MSENFDFKFISSSDLDLIVPLYQIIDDKLSESLIRQRFYDLLKGDYKIIVVFSKEHNKVIGMTGLSYGMRVYCGSYIELHHMVVLPEWRGCGIATGLIKYAEHYALMRDVDGLTLDSYFHAINAHNLYEKNGYVAIGKHFVKKI